MVIKRGEVWWAEMPTPTGSEPGFGRPVVIVSSDTYNRSGISTVIAVSITANMSRETAPGNVKLSRKESGLPRISVANVTQLVTLDKRMLREQVKRLPATAILKIDKGLRQTLSL